MSLPEAALPYAETITRVRAQIGPSLRSLLMFGSCLSPRMSHATSIPDLFALVDDVDEALVQLGAGRIARWAARVLPPITLSFREGGSGPPLAKLNLVTPAVIEEELTALRDLYLAARLSKRIEIAYARDEACAREVDALVEHAASVMTGVALLAPPREIPVERLVERCVTVSYSAEPRPERENKLRSLFETFAAHYHARFRPLVGRQAGSRGLRLEGDLVIDERSDDVRREEARTLVRILRRSRRRMMARWPKQALVYRGWLPYLVQKLRRAKLTG